MSVTNHRHQPPDSVHHLISQIAHQVRFLNDAERDDFLSRVYRVSDFCGVVVLGWCVMSTHFHLLVYLPPESTVSDEELRRRVALLNSDDLMLAYEGCIRMSDFGGLRSRLGNIGMFMKMVKQGFTISYNMLNDHKGTMWSGPYTDRPVRKTVEDMSYRLAYLNLNPYRAGMCETYDGYRWTSFAAARKGDPRALAGLRFIYDRPVADDEETSGPEDGCGEAATAKPMSDDDLVMLAEKKMDELAAADERKRAESVWRKRVTGDLNYMDPLTTEAMVAQVTARMERLETEAFRQQLSDMLACTSCDPELKVVKAMAMDPEITTRGLSECLKLSLSHVKRISLALQKAGVIVREGTNRCGCWIIPILGAA